MPGIVETHIDTCFIYQFTPGMIYAIRTIGCTVIVTEYKIAVGKFEPKSFS